MKVVLGPPSVPSHVPAVVWIGSGGSAASAATQLNVNLGGTDTVGSSSAPSGVAFTSGGFASQTE